MRKLKLQMEALAVDSFPTSHEASGRGTAHAHSNDMALEPVVPPDVTQGAGGPTQDYGLETASCTQCDTCNGATC
jgi:hypothetical protein